MTKIIVGLLAVAVILFLIFRAGVAYENTEDTINTLKKEKEIDDAVASCDTLSWFERLQCGE